MTERNKCIKGYSCGAACINMQYKCTDAMAESANSLIDKYLSLLGVAKDNKLNSTKSKKTTTDEVLDKYVSKVQDFQALAELDPKFAKLADTIQKGIDEGSIGSDQLDSINAIYSSLITKPITDRTGSKLMPLDSIETFVENTDIADKFVNAYEASFDENDKFVPTRQGGIKDFVDSNVKRTEISKELAESVMNTLPDKTLNKLKKAGDPREGYWAGSFDSDGVPDMTNKGGKERNIALVQRYLEQKGIDPYDKKFVHFNDAELEHLVPDSKGKGRADQPDNFAWISAANNKSHDSDTARQWVERLKSSIQDKDAFKKSYEASAKRAEEGAKASKGAGDNVDKLFEISDRNERQAYAKQLAITMKSKAKKLLSSAGTKESFQELRPHLPKKDKQGNQSKGFKNRTKSIDEGSTVIMAEYADIFGKQKPSSLVIQALAFLRDDPDAYNNFVKQYEEIMFKREIGEDEVYDIIKAGDPGNISVSKIDKPAFSKALKERNIAFAKDLTNLLQSIEGFNA